MSLSLKYQFYGEWQVKNRDDIYLQRLIMVNNKRLRAFYSGGTEL
jgi:hypothetical protein